MLGCSHYTLVEELSNEEFLGWVNFFERNPDGWRDDLRTYYIMSSMSGGKQKPEDIFPSIKRLKQEEADMTEEEERIKAMRSFQASPFGALMAQANKKAKQ